jgi:beta-galactosidase
MRRHIVLFAALALLAPLALAAPSTPDAPRAIEQFTSGWKFLKADAPGAEKPGFDDSAWRAVTLPHDWSIEGPFEENAPSRAAGAFLPTGVGWYRKSFNVHAADAKPDAARRMFIVFDGVMANSDVYLNGELLGHRPYGYVSFVYELTPHLKPGANVVAVRVDDSQQPASRWYPGAGINRQVRLVTTGDAHIAPWGTFVTTPAISPESATVHVRTTVTNESATPAKLSISVKLTAPNGTPMAALATGPLTVAPGATADIDAETAVANPDRWDIGHPAMYTVHATLLRDNIPVDNEDVAFGIREFHFDPNQGFFLNGKHHKIFGAAMHTDAGALGTAVPLAAWERRLTALRKLGVNAIRTAHNPPAPEFLDLADRMGFLIMDEMFDCWTVGKNPYDYHLYFREWSQRDTADTVKRDRNHPSIILYSAGNEIHDTPNQALAHEILSGLVKTFHENDPTRPVTQALFRPNVSHDYDNGLADLLDVVGQNYREKELLAAHAQNPKRAIIGTENTHDRNQWLAMRDHPEFSGEFLWTGVDYLGEAGRWPTIGSGSGLILTTALPRARAFERQSWWSATPMVAIARRVQQNRAGPVDPGYASPTSTDQAAAPAAAPAPLDPTTRFSQPLLTDWSPKNTAPHTENLEIYTNAEEVELFLNDKSLGTQRLHADASPITYQVAFVPGTLKAVAKIKGKVVATDEIKTAGKPAKIAFVADYPNAALTPSFNSVRYIVATLEDEAGTRIPDSSTVIHFSITGPGTIVAVDNGNLVDHDPFQATQRKLYDGNAVAIVRATDASGKVTVTASSDGVTPGSVTLATQAARPQSLERSF